jgi:hypothetical protein
LKGIMKMKRSLKLILIASLLLTLGEVANMVSAQDIQTKGSIGGTITDANGAALPGASVTVTGALGERRTNTDSNGVFAVDNLTPGRYTVRAENSGFKTTVVSGVDVFVGRQSNLTVKLEPGEVSATVEVTGAGNIDIESSATSSNLNDQLFDNIPVQRSVSSLFYSTALRFVCRTRTPSSTAE